MQRLTVRRVGTVFAVTPALRDEMARIRGPNAPSWRSTASNAPASTMCPRVSRRAVRSARWRGDAFIVGCIGVDGVNTLMAALALAWAQPGGFQASLALIGVPEVAVLRQEWLKLGLSPELFLSVGTVPVSDIPLHLSACDVCVLPLPRTEHNTFYASPLRLFEYMASRRALIASDLPAWDSVLTDGEHALLVGASDARELAEALTRLYGDPLLRQTLADSAHTHVMQHYAWDVRAEAILKKLFPKKPSDNSKTA
ncbi:MAG: glycosyltransferase [Anaerolineae bacterium]